MAKEENCGWRVRDFVNSLEYLILSMGWAQSKDGCAGAEYTPKSITNTRFMLFEIIENMPEFATGREIVSVTELLILFEDIDIKLE